MKKKGLVGSITTAFVWIFWGAIFIALLKRFDWDLFELVTWIISLFAEAIDKLSNFFLGSKTFNRIVQSILLG